MKTNLSPFELGKVRAYETPADCVHRYRTRYEDQLAAFDRIAADESIPESTRSSAAMHAAAMRHKLVDARDWELLTEYIAATCDQPGPIVGDFVLYPGGELERVSYVHGYNAQGGTVQTSPGGSFHLGRGYVSFSGGLNPGVQRSSLTDTGYRRDGTVWIAHHGRLVADCARNVNAPFRIYTTTEPGVHYGSSS